MRIDLAIMVKKYSVITYTKCSYQDMKQTNTHTNTGTHAHTYMHTHTHTPCTHIHAHTYMHTHTQTCTHSYIIG